jgi:plasmid stabilization system protein ParE
MPRGDKSKYTDKQERKADHIAEGYEKRGVPEKEAERRAWATVNKDDGGGKNPGGSGRGKRTGHPARIGAAALAAKLPLQDPRQLAQHPPRRRRPRANVADIERLSHELKASRAECGG